MKRFSVWLKAARVPAQLFIFPGILLGVALAYYEGGEVERLRLVIVFSYGVFMHLFIVFSNDLADFKTDALNQSFTPFTGGSRVLVLGLLGKKQLKIASIVALILVFLSSVMLSMALISVLPFAFALIGVLLMQAYSFKPVALSYRGAGEILQMLGVGVILPIMGYLALLGSLDGLNMTLIVALLPAQFAMALSTSLPDAPSDKVSNKRTSVVLLGVKKSRVLLVMLYGLSVVALVFVQSEIITPVALSLFMGLIALEFWLAFKPTNTPGTVLMTVFVALSIITNTTLSLFVALSLMFL